MNKISAATNAYSLRKVKLAADSCITRRKFNGIFMIFRIFCDIHVIFGSSCILLCFLQFFVIVLLLTFYFLRFFVIVLQFFTKSIRFFLVISPCSGSYNCISIISEFLSYCANVSLLVRLSHICSPIICEAVRTICHLVTL